MKIYTPYAGLARGPYTAKPQEAFGKYLDALEEEGVPPHLAIVALCVGMTLFASRAFHRNARLGNWVVAFMSSAASELSVWREFLDDWKEENRQAIVTEAQEKP